VDGEPPKLLNRVRQAIRARHYSRRTEEAYAYWIRKYVVFHGKAHPATLGASHISAFLIWLADRRHVSASTQNQALSALLFLYREVLTLDIGEIAHIPRARMPVRVPVVLARDEVRAIMMHLGGVPWLVVALFDRQESMTVRRRVLGMAWENNFSESRGGTDGEIC
jgi:site-specific recombinase XerD